MEPQVGATKCYPLELARMMETLVRELGGREPYYWNVSHLRKQGVDILELLNKWN